MGGARSGRGWFPQMLQRPRRYDDEESQIRHPRVKPSLSAGIELVSPDAVLNPNTECLRHGSSPFRALKPPSGGSEAIPRERTRLVVGEGDDQRSYLVHRSLLMHYSKYFGTVYRSRSFTEAQINIFTLPEDQPDDIEVFLHWLYLCPYCKKSPGYDREHKCITKPRVAEGEWCNLDAMLAAWVAADRILAMEFLPFCLGHIAQHISSLTPDMAKWVYENTIPGSPLRRLIRHYAGYLNTSGDRKEKAAPLKQIVEEHDTEESCSTPLWSTRDPKKYRAEHWDTAGCGTNLNATCEHYNPSRPPPGTVRERYFGFTGPETISLSRYTMRNIARILWVSMPIAILSLAGAIFHLDQSVGDVTGSEKRLGLAVGILAVIGMRYQWVAHTNLIVSLAAGALVLERSVKRDKFSKANDYPLPTSCKLAVAMGVLLVLNIPTVAFCTSMLEYSWRTHHNTDDGTGRRETRRQRRRT